tara:strand:+ start:115 stop:360 length:246 start_codon:yes stop_codon:yes gene_type:complete
MKKRRLVGSKEFEIFIKCNLEQRKKMIKGCLGKERHKTLAEARKAKKENEEIYNVRARFYRCDHCGNFHITTQFNNKTQKI